MPIIIKKKSPEPIKATEPPPSGLVNKLVFGIKKAVQPIATTNAVKQMIVANQQMQKDFTTLKDAGFENVQDSFVVPPEEELTQRQKDALEAIGLGPTKPVPSIPPADLPPVKISAYKGIYKSGTPVRICYDLFKWLETRKVGDTGVVLRDWPTTMPAGATLKEKEDYHLYEVQLDKPRDPKKPTVLMRSWELEEIK